MAYRSGGSLIGAFISTEGALRLPTTYDNHPSQSHLTHAIPQSLFNNLNRPWMKGQKEDE